MISTLADIFQVPHRGFALRVAGKTILVADLVRRNEDDFITHELKAALDLARSASAIVVIERPYPDIPLEHCLRPNVMQAIADILTSGPLTCEIFVGRRSALLTAACLAREAPGARVFVATAFGLFRREAL